MAFSPRGGAVISFTVEGAQTAQRQIETVGASLDQLAAVARTGLTALAAGFAALKIADYIKDSTLLAARYETLAIVMHTAGENAGYSNAQMDAYAKGLERSGISMVKAREAMTAMTTANLDNNKSLELGRLAQNLAVVANKSSSETLTDLITNIQQADTEGLKHMGIILNQDEALQKYATSHNTVTKALTQTQKAEAIQQAVMLQGAKYAGIYEKAMGTAGKALSSLDRYFENIKVRLGTPFLEGFAQGVFGVTDGVKQLNKWLDTVESNGAMEAMAKSIGSSVGAVISVIKDVIDVTGQIGSGVISVGKTCAEFFDKYLGGMTTVKTATAGFALLLSGFMVEQAIIGFTALGAVAWAAAARVGGAMLTMSVAATNTFRLMQLSAATLGWGPAIAIAGRTALAAIGTTIAAIPGAVGAATVAAGLAVGYVFVKAFGNALERMMPDFIDKWVDRVVAKVASWTSSLPEVSEAVKGGTVIDDAKAAANKAEIKRKEQLARDMNAAVVGAEGQVAITAAANTRLKALNEARDQQLKQSLDQRIITQADYLQKKERMDVAEAQGQLNQIAAQKAQLAAYMAAFKAGAPLGQGRDPAADANEMIKLSAEEAAAQTKLNAVKQSYAYQIADAVIESYTKEFGTITSLVDAQGVLVRSTRIAYQEAGKTAEQRELLAAQHMADAAEQLSIDMEAKRASGEASKEYITNTSAMITSLNQMSAARVKAVSTNVAAVFINDAKQMRDETAALYLDMKNTFTGTDEERVRSAAAASIALAQIRLRDAQASIDDPNYSATEDQKAAKKKQLLADYSKYVDAVTANADIKAKQASIGFRELADTLSAAFDPARVENFGQTLASAFGTAGDALGSLLDTFEQFDRKQRVSEASRLAAVERFKGEPEKLAAANEAINAKQNKDSLAYYASMTGAAKDFFKENTTGYKLMEGAEKAFRVMELAFQMESLYNHLFVTTAKVAGTAAGQVAETTAVGAGETARNALKVPGVFMSFMSALGPWGMAAAGVAIAAVLGGAFSGGPSVDIAKDRQAAQGAGSILGDKDAKSESIKKSLDLVAKNSYQGLAISTSMLATLRSIDSNTAAFASQLVRSTDISNPDVALKSGNMLSSLLGNAPLVGGLLGKLATSIFGGKQSVEDSGFGMDAASLASILGNGARAYQYADIKTSGGWFSSDKHSEQTTALNDSANQQFTGIIASEADTIRAAAGMLGLAGDDFTNKLNSFAVDIGHVSLKDLKGDDLQKALESVFSKLGDQMAQYAIGGLQDLQKVGEGYLETLARVATEYQTIDVVFQSFGKTFGQVGLESIAARDRLVQLAGGLDQFTSQGEYFLKNFFTDQEQAAALRARIDPTLAQYGLSSAGENADKMFRNFIVGLDTTTEEGAKAYTTLMTVAPALRAVIDAGKDVLDERKGLLDQLDDLTMSDSQKLAKKRAALLSDENRGLFDQVQVAQAAKDARTLEMQIMGLSGDKAGELAANRAIEIAGMAETLRPLQQRIYALQDEAAALETSKSLLELQAQIYALTGDKAGAAAVLQQQHVNALAALDPALRGATQQLWDLQAAANAVDKVKSDGSALLNNVDNAFSVLQGVVGREKEMLQKRIDLESGAVDRLKSLTDSIGSTLDSFKVPGTEVAMRQAAQAQIRGALEAVRGGSQLSDDQIKSLTKAFSTVSQDAPEQFATYSDYLRDRLQTKNDIAALGDLTGDQLSAQQTQLDFDKRQVEQYDLMLSNAQEQINVLKGISTTGLSIEMALQGLGTAILGAQGNASVAGVSAISAAYKSALGRAPDSAGLDFWQDKAASGVPISAITAAITGSAEAQVQKMYKDLLGRPADAGGLQFWQGALGNGMSPDDIKAWFMKSDEYKGLHPFAVGTNFIPEDMPAYLHKGEAVIPAADNRLLLSVLSRAASPQGSSEALVAEVRGLRADNAALRDEVKELRKVAERTASSTAQFADQFENATDGGNAMRADVINAAVPTKEVG